LVDHLAIEEADFLGFSLGGMVEIVLALRRPDLVGKLVIASIDHRPGHAEFHSPDDPEVSQRMPTESDFQAMSDAYAQVAPDPDRFDEVASKTSAMVQAAEGWTDDELGSIQAPTLLIVGDTDFVPLGHAVEMYELIPNAQLAVLPEYDSRCRHTAPRADAGPHPAIPRQRTAVITTCFPDPHVGWVCPN